MISKAVAAVTKLGRSKSRLKKRNRVENLREGQTTFQSLFLMAKNKSVFKLKLGFNPHRINLFYPQQLHRLDRVPG